MTPFFTLPSVTLITSCDTGAIGDTHTLVDVKVLARFENGKTHTIKTYRLLVDNPYLEQLLQQISADPLTPDVKAEVYIGQYSYATIKDTYVDHLALNSFAIKDGYAYDQDNQLVDPARIVLVQYELYAKNLFGDIILPPSLSFDYCSYIQYPDVALDDEALYIEQACSALNLHSGIVAEIKSIPYYNCDSYRALSLAVKVDTNVHYDAIKTLMAQLDPKDRSVSTTGIVFKAIILPIITPFIKPAQLRRY